MQNENFQLHSENVQAITYTFYHFIQSVEMIESF